MTIVTSVVTVFGPVIDPIAWSNQVALKSEYTVHSKNSNFVLQIRLAWPNFLISDFRIL